MRTRTIHRSCRRRVDGDDEDPEDDRRDQREHRLEEVQPVRVQVDCELLVVVEQLLRVRHGGTQYRRRDLHVVASERTDTPVVQWPSWTRRALLGDLDAEQRAAVTTPSTLVAVIAAAGSGKTRVLARRIAYRVATGTADARHTLALTFTRQAAGELRRRLRAAGLRESIEAGTFHSVALGVMRQRWADEGRPAPNVTNDRHRLIAEVAGRCPVDTIAAERSWCAARGIEPDGYVAAARAAKRHCGVPPATVAQVLADYETDQAPSRRHRPRRPAAGADA